MGELLDVSGAGALTQSPEYSYLALPVAIISGTIFVVLGLMYLVSNRREIYALVRKVEPSHVIILGLVIALSGVVWQMRKTSPMPTATALVSATPLQGNDTHLHLKFGSAGTNPIAIDLANVWRWYALQTIAGVMLPDGQRRDIKSWSLFMTFEKPVDVKQVIVEGLNLPPHEVKDRDSRSVVIAFLGDILDKSLKVRIDSSVGAKAEVAKSDTPAQIQQAQTPPPPPAPAPRPLSAYEAEQKIIAIDKVLKILSNDMQVVIDKYPPLQNWWNALKDPANNPEFGATLLAFRDEFKAACLKLDSLRNQIPEYQDLTDMTSQPEYGRTLKSIEDYLIRFNYVEDSVKKSASGDALKSFLDPLMGTFAQSMTDFIGWRNTTKANVLALRKGI